MLISGVNMWGRRGHQAPKKILSAQGPARHRQRRSGHSCSTLNHRQHGERECPHGGRVVVVLRLGLADLRIELRGARLHLRDFLFALRLARLELRLARLELRGALTDLREERMKLRVRSLDLALCCRNLRVRVRVSV